MALTPMIVIGCGGSGGKVVVALRQRLEVELRRLGWDEGLPDAWQLMYVDTPGAQETNLEYGAPVPDSDYISTSVRQQVYAPIDEAVANHAKKHQALNRLVGWRPPPELPVPVTDGAGQWRAVGRIVAFHGLNGFARRLKQGLTSCNAGQAQLQRLGEKLGDASMPGTTPFVIVISSMAGGTGAGIFVDICDVARTVEPDLQDRIMSVLFTAEVFQNLKGGSGLQPNTVGVLAELMAGYFDRNRAIEPLYGGMVDVQQHALTSSGPSYPFVVGMQTLAGQSLSEISQSYRAVTETLAAAMMSPNVYKDLLEFQITNWTNNALPNVTKWSFGNPTYAGEGMRPGGMVSSFGSSRLSVGSVLFGEYAVHRLTREMVEFLIEGHLNEGRQLLQDPTATQDQVLDYFRAERGLKFVGDCQVRELNDPDAEYDQVLEVVLPPDEVRSHMRSWWTTVSNELASFGSLSKGQWMQAIRDVVPNRLLLLTAPVQREVDEHIARLALELPERVVDETSRIMSELGVPVARELVAYADEHVRQSVKQLRYEANEERRRGESWADAIGQALTNLSQRDKVGRDHALIGGEDGAIKKATMIGYRHIRALARDRTADFLERFARQVLTPLVAQLDQVIQQLADPDIRAEIAKFPAESGVPTRFSPTPFDFCLTSVDDWPNLYKRLVRETARQEQDQRFVANAPEATVRRMVGGGGFKVSRSGQTIKVPAAIQLPRAWTMDKAVQFETSLNIVDVTARVREWVGRDDMAIGSFIAQNLDTYLRPTGPDGSPLVEHPQRIAKFQDQLSAALKAATPLVAIDSNVLLRVHPNSTMANNMTSLDVQPLPVRGRAREVAERVLAPYAQEHSKKELGDFFDDGTTSAESVLIVSQLAGAVHPSAVMSLTQPIAAAWQKTKVSSTTINGFWQYRRARILPEAIPVSPGVLQSMIKGWFLGRAFGLIPDPIEQDGFSIGTPDGVKRFPWPLLRCGHLGNGLAARTHQFDWLPAILETLGLAYMLVPTEPNILDAYEALFQTGSRAEITMDRWILTGSLEGAICPARVPYAGPNDQTYDSLHDTLVETKQIYTERIGATVLRPEPSEFFKVDYGHALYPDIVAALGALSTEIPRPTNFEMPL